ncbi:uncharacterized protein arhgap33 [Polymixia lowei]
MNKRSSVVKGHFPKLADCAHFHYDNVDFGSIQLQYISDQGDANWSGSSTKDMVFMVQVTCQGKLWMVRRSYDEFCTLDAHLHQCIYDRRYSKLPLLPSQGQMREKTETLCPLLSEYLTRLSVIVDNKLNCGPVLTWMEIDNRGNRFLLKEEASLNVPAIAAAHVVKRYTAQASDEISIEVGDILSVIDMPPKEETSWWRGKYGFQVGFFPSECVELINEKLPQSVSASSAKTVSKKHGKLLGFLRTFIKSRPSKQKLKLRGILKERVFGCDLGEHLLNSGLDVPQVLISCSEFIEQHGVVDGIYRHSGVSSNIQKLRHEFDSEMVPDLTKEVYMQDIHCVGSLCKLYFRELPNPLLTYQLYDKFADCMGEMSDEERMVKVHDVIQQLPPPHYRTLEYLIRHLARLADWSEETNMHIKNLAIVWAPNLLRSKEIETAGLVGSDPFREVRVQSVVVEFLLNHVNVLFSDSFTSVGKFAQRQQYLDRPKSFVSTRLLSLEEAQARTQAPLLLQGVPQPLQQGQYHTVLDIQDNRGKRGLKGRKTAGSWKTFFAIGKPTRKPMRISSLFQPNMTHIGCRVDSVTLRSAKSEESLSSQHSGAGSGQVQRLRRPRSSSDGLAAAMDTQLISHHPPSSLPSTRSYDSLLPRDQCHGDQEREFQEEDGDDEDEDEGEEGVYMLPDFSSQEPASSWMAEDVINFSPTFLEDGPLGLGTTRESPPTGSPPAYHCLSHQVQRPITEDPDSVLNQSEAAARRSLILAATAPQQQVFCQHQPSNSSPAQVETINQSTSHGIILPPDRLSFTKKVVHALSPKAAKSPPLDISQPIAISVPAKVLEMIGGRAGESQPSGSYDSAPPPQMISMLLRSCDFQLSDTCQQELHSKLGTAVPGTVKGIPGLTGAPLPPQQPPPPPPKNPARLMALVLAESANRALRHQGASPPYRPRQAEHRPPHTSPNNKDTGTLSSETSDSVASDLSRGSSSGDDHTPNLVYTNQSKGSRPSPSQSQPVRKKPPAYGRQLSAPHLQQKTTTTPTATAASVITTSSVSVSTQNISTSTQQSSPQPQQHFSSHSQVSQSSLLSQPTYPQLFQPLLHHSRSESSPLSQVHSLQSSRPKVPPKPLDLVAPQRDRDSPSQRNRDLSFQVAPGPHREPREHNPLAKSNLHRSLDSGKIRCLIGQPGGQPPLVRAFSERLSGAPDRLTRYHAARAASQHISACHPPPATSLAPAAQPSNHNNIQVLSPSSTNDRGKMENFYYEIGASESEHPLPLQPSLSHAPSYARDSYLNFRMELEGNCRPAHHHLQSHPYPQSDHAGNRPLSRCSCAHQGRAEGNRGQPWSSEATRSLRCHDNRPHPQQNTSSSVKGRSEMHPLPPSSFSPLVPAVLSSRTFAAPPLRGGSPARSSHPPHPHPAPLHPYFENGRVCYRAQDTNAHASAHTLTMHAQLRPVPCPQPQPSQSHTSQRHDRQPNEDQSEPIYVNYPFTPSPSSLPLPTPSPLSLPPSQGWATSDLDSPHDALLLSPLLPVSSGEQRDLPSFTSPTVPPSSLNSPPSTEPTTASQLDPDRPTSTGVPPSYTQKKVREGGMDGRREPREGEMEGREGRKATKYDSFAASGGQDLTQSLSGQDIATLLMKKMVEEEREEKGGGPDILASSPSFSSPHVDSPMQQPQSQQHPPNPYAPPQCLVQPPPPSYSASSSSHRASFQFREALQHSSKGVGQYYCQAFDVLPSSDQVLRFHRPSDEGPNYYPQRPGYHDPLYPPRRSSQPSTLLASLSADDSTGYYPHQPQPLGGHGPPPKAQYSPRRELVPEASAVRGLVRQGSLPGANWSQTRSYC